MFHKKLWVIAKHVQVAASHIYGMLRSKDRSRAASTESPTTTCTTVFGKWKYRALGSYPSFIVMSFIVSMWCVTWSLLIWRVRSASDPDLACMKYLRALSVNKNYDHGCGLKLCKTENGTWILILHEIWYILQICLIEQQLRMQYWLCIRAPVLVPRLHSACMLPPLMQPWESF